VATTVPVFFRPLVQPPQGLQDRADFVPG